MYWYFLYFLLKPNQQALKRKDSNVHCGSIGRRNNGFISSNNNQCLVNLALMRHSLWLWSLKRENLVEGGLVL